MANNRPFTYYTGPTAAGTTKLGDITIGQPTSGFLSTESDWWAGPDESLGYVVCLVDTINKRNTPIGIQSNIGFKRSTALTEASFIQLANSIALQTFNTGNEAANWLTSNGYWTTWTVTDIIRSSLGSTAQGLYDGATEGNFISVTSTDYNNVISALSATINGTTESEFSGGSGTPWGGLLGMINPTQSPLSSSSYIVGFSHIPNSSGTHGIFVSTTGVTGTYNRVGNAVTGGSSQTRIYWIRKSPSSTIGDTGYVSILSTVSFTAKGPSINPTYYKGGVNGSTTSFGSPFSTWSSNNAFPAFQYITTTNRQW